MGSLMVTKPFNSVTERKPPPPPPLLFLLLLTKPRNVSVEIKSSYLWTVKTGSAPYQRGPPVVGGLPLPALPVSSLSFLLTPLPSLSVVPQQPYRGN